MSKRPSPPVTTDLSGIRTQLTRLLAEGSHDSLIELVLGLLGSMAQQNTQLAIRLQAALRQMYRKKSERVSPEQLALFLAALKDEEAATAEPQRDGPVDEASVGTPPPLADGLIPVKPVKRPRKKPFPEGLRRDVRLVPVSDADRLCAQCGGAKDGMGYEVTELWEFIPAEFFIIEERLEKCVCKHCQEGVVTALATPKPIEGGRPGPGLLAQIVTSKTRDGCPLYRQADIYERSGIHLSTSTLGDWFAATADMLEPLWQLARRLTLSGYLLSLDDTGMPVLDGDHPNGIKRGHLWTYLGDYDRVGFCEYTPNWRGEAPCSVLDEFKGKVVQGDGYAGINAYFEKPNAAARAGCMDHCRRKWLDALEAGHKMAAVVVALIQQVYAVESTARKEGVGPEELLRRRQEISRPLMNKLKVVIADIRLTVVPKSAMGKATTYSIRQWETLCVFLDDARVPLSNAHVERQLRRVAIGRKSYLFAGSDEGARRLAILQTIVVLCELHDVPMFEYLRDVIGKLASGWLMSRLPELLPSAWAANQETQKLQTQAAAVVASAAA